MITRHVGFPGTDPLFLPVGLYLTISLMTITGGQAKKEEEEETWRRKKRKHIRKAEENKRQCRLYNLDQKFWKMDVWINAKM